MSAVIETAFEWAWRTSLAAAPLLILVVALDLLPARMFASRWRYWLGLLAFLRLALPSAPESSFSAYNLAPSHIQSPTPVLQAIDETEGSALPIEATESVLAEPQHLIRERILAIAWALGALVVLAISGVRYQRLRMALRGAMEVEDARVLTAMNEAFAIVPCRARPRMVLVPGTWTPALFGAFRPTLLWPSGLEDRISAAQAKLLMVHELAHLKRRDNLVDLMVVLARAVHWFNPMVWAAASSVRRAQEYECDRLALSKLNASAPGCYAETLVQLAEVAQSASPTPTLLPVLNGPSEIKRRLHMIIHRRKFGRSEALIGALLIAVIGVTTFTRAEEKHAAVDQSTAGNSRAVSTKPVATPADPTDAGQLARTPLEELEYRRREYLVQVGEAEDRLTEASSLASPKAIERFEAERISARARRVAVEHLLLMVEEQGRRGNVAAIQILYPEANLTPLLESIEEAQRSRSALQVEMGDSNPKILAVTARLDTLERQLAARALNVEKGIRAKVEMERASESRFAALAAPAQEITRHRAELDRFRFNLAQIETQIEAEKKKRGASGGGTRP